MLTEERHAHIFQLNRSNGGVPKLPVFEVMVTAGGMEGDRQRDLEHHGGPDRALCLYALETILRLQREGHPIHPGSIGENVTLVGVDFSVLGPGSVLELGDEVVVELTDYAHPCSNIARSFADGKFSRVSQKLHPGESRVYVRVHRGGRLRPGMPVRVIGDGEPPSRQDS